jgi:hypothetical protein
LNNYQKKQNNDDRKTWEISVSSSKPPAWAAFLRRAARWGCRRPLPARLVKLEAALNTRLFERTTRRLRLTAEGAMYLAHCQQALAALDDAQAALQAGRSAVSGKLRIAATSDFGRNAAGVAGGIQPPASADHAGADFGRRRGQPGAG